MDSVRVLEAITPSPSSSEGVGLLFSALVFVYFIKVSCVDWPEAAKVPERREDMKADIDKLYNGMVQEALSNMKALRLHPSHQSQLSFQDKYRDLVGFLRRCEQDENLRLLRGKWLERFQALVGSRMQAFKHAGLHPESLPLVLVHAERLKQGETIPDVAAIAISESQGKLLDIRSITDEVQAMHQRVAELKREMPKTAAPTWRLSALLQLSFVVGICLCTLLHVSGKHLSGFCVVAALFMLIMMLARVDILNAALVLEYELHEFDLRKRRVEEVHSELLLWIERYSLLCNLWRYRTLSLLDLYESCSGYTRFLGSEEFPHDERRDELEAVDEGLGGLSLWVGEDALDKQWLANAATELKVSVGRLREAWGKNDAPESARVLRNVFTFLVVRVRSERTSPLFRESSYLTARFSKREGSSTLEWDEELFSLVGEGENTVVVEVHLDGAVAGSASLDFRGRPGQWASFLCGTPVQGPELVAEEASVAIELFFGTSIKQYGESRRRAT